jgi:hypothetical protein
MTVPTSPDDVRIFQPDTALKKKLGGASFDQVVTPQAIASAEEVIIKSSAEILATIMNDLVRLQKAMDQLSVNAAANTALTPIIETAFAIKSNAGLCGYPFASSLAKSLHVYCERDAVQQQPLSAKSLAILRSQMAGLKTIFANKITGDGGKVGAAILQELGKLTADS